MNKRNILLAVLVLFVIAQFFGIDKNNPPTDMAKDFITIEKPPQAIATMLKNVCYDCHSNETKYPWYTNIAPVSWWIKGHIDEGREHLNYSEWATYKEKKKSHKFEEMAELVEATEMPFITYVIMHPEAKMSTEERKELVDWFKSKE